MPNKISLLKISVYYIYFNTLLFSLRKSYWVSKPPRDDEQCRYASIVCDVFCPSPELWRRELLIKCLSREPCEIQTRNSNPVKTQLKLDPSESVYLPFSALHYISNEPVDFVMSIFKLHLSYRQRIKIREHLCTGVLGSYCIFRSCCCWVLPRSYILRIAGRPNTSSK